MPGVAEIIIIACWVVTAVCWALTGWEHLLARRINRRNRR